MSEPPPGRPSNDDLDTADPDALLDAIRDRPEWTNADRAAALDRLVVANPPERIREVLSRRFSDLGGPHGEAVLMLLASFTTSELLDAFADHRLPDRPAGRASLGGAQPAGRDGDPRIGPGPGGESRGRRRVERRRSLCSAPASRGAS